MRTYRLARVRDSNGLAFDNLTPHMATFWCRPCGARFSVWTCETLARRWATCDHCRAVGHVARTDAHQLARQLYDRDAMHDPVDVLDFRTHHRPAFLLPWKGFYYVRREPWGDPAAYDPKDPYRHRAWRCPRCFGRRPWLDHTCWECGWSHYDHGAHVANLDLDQIDRDAPDTPESARAAERYP